MKDGITIRDLRPDDDIPAITALLHESYAPLAATGLRFLASHQDDVTTRTRLHSGDPLVATFAGRIAGTITLYATAPDSPAQWYRRPGVFRIGQFAVRPDLQRQGIGLRLLRTAERRARERGATDLALDTAEGAQHLRRWYETLWLRRDLRERIEGAPRVIEKGVVCWSHWNRGLLLTKPIRMFGERR